jgi:hypothetical protein
MFQRRREEIKRQIADAIAVSDASRASELAVLSLSGSSAAISRDEEAPNSTRLLPDSHARLRVHDATPLATQSSTRLPTRKKPVMPLVTVLGVIGVGVILVLAFRGGHREPERAPPAQAAPLEKPVEPAKIDLTVRATPATAVIFLDDKPLPENPWIGHFPRSSEEHTIRVEASGYTTATRTVRFQESAMIDVALAPAPRPSASSPKPAPPPAPRGNAKPSARPQPKLESDPWN